MKDLHGFHINSWNGHSNKEYREKVMRTKKDYREKSEPCYKPMDNESGEYVCNIKCHSQISIYKFTNIIYQQNYNHTMATVPNCIVHIAFYFTTFISYFTITSYSNILYSQIC